MHIKYYRDLLVWQKAMDLCVEVHNATLVFPKQELFGLSAQLNRSVVSVPSNIAEGHGRRTTPDFIHFLSISRGSMNEVETQITLAMCYNYILESDHDELLERCGEVGRMLNGLIEALERRLATS
ncbi:MAG: four helix bundle protein [Luteolibacter sp.]|uniref:four helix bundle protein n=1 Tax=Luteolibacter sp. TaxID=1962973 RepID=UPI0032630AB4